MEKSNLTKTPYYPLIIIFGLCLLAGNFSIAQETVSEDRQASQFFTRDEVTQETEKVDQTLKDLTALPSSQIALSYGVSQADVDQRLLDLGALRSSFEQLQASFKALEEVEKDRLDATKEALINARKDFDRAKLLILWKEQEIDVQVAGIKIAKLAVDLAEMERDLAWISKLKERNLATGQKYDLADFQNCLGKKQKAYQTAVTQNAVAMETARKLRTAYEKASP